MTEKQLIELLRKRIKYGTNQQDLARELDISQSFLSEVLAGKKAIGSVLPVKMGFKIDYKKAKK